MLDEAETTLTSIDQASERLVQNVLKQAQTAKPSYGQQQLHKAAAPSGMAEHAAYQPIAGSQLSAAVVAAALSSSTVGHSAPRASDAVSLQRMPRKWRHFTCQACQLCCLLPQGCSAGRLTC